MKTQASISPSLVFIIIVALVGGLLILQYNSIVSCEKIVEEAAAQIEVVCQRRLDLIPNLISTVKGYAGYERSTLEAIVRARNEAQAALDQFGSGGGLTKENMMALAASQSQLTTGLKSLWALVENYPDLKANTNFLLLQDQLEGTENRISIARQRYNQTVRLLNTKINVFPGNIVAVAFGFEDKAYYEAPQEAMSPVKVDF